MELLFGEGLIFFGYKNGGDVHSKLCSITHVTTKVHMILRIFMVLTWMCDTIELM
jgi:hypothetical protein